MKPARTAIALTASATAVALTGCSLQLDPERGTPPEPNADATTGGTLHVGITPPGRIDPIGAATPGARMISQAMCDTLVSLDPVTRQVRPGLAKAYVEAENGSFLTFQPIHGLKLSDGNTLGGQDLSASVKALLAPYNGSPFRELAAPFKGGVLGSEQKNKSKLNPLLAEGEDADRQPVQLLNDYDGQVKANPANSSSTRIFADPALAPVSKQAMEDDITAFAANPTCVGPYTLAEPYHSEAKTITLERNTDYFADNLAYTRGGAGWADSIVFHVYPDAEAALQAYQDGEVDISPVPGKAALTPDGLPEGLRSDVAQATATRMEYVGIPIEADKAFGSPAVRQALSLALDRRKLAEAAGLGNAPASGFFPPSLGIEPGEKAEEAGLQLPQCSAAPAEGDVEQAKAILKKAGISLEGMPMMLEFDDTELSMAIMGEVARQWNEAFGMQASAETGQFWDAYQSAARFGAGFSAPFRFSWGTDAVKPVPTSPNAQSYIEQLFMQPKATNFNWTGWSSKEFDDTVEQKLADTNDQRTQGQVLSQLGDTLCSQMPYIPILENAPTWLIRPGALGAARSVSTGVDGLPLLRELYVTEAEKKSEDS